jgi:glucan 1,3-beta-glucosidase
MVTGAHTSYWQSHGGSPDPAVFAPGFAQGWDDALIFFSDPSGSSEMGFVSQWARRRKADYEAGGRKLGRAAWEWEHGFAEGVQACKTASLQ